ncbi:TPA: tail fiber assembly protein [Serratia marcescens]
MNGYFYSARRNGFYTSLLKGEYDMSSGGWPDDSIPITDDEYRSLLDGLANGMMLTAGEDGLPVLVPPKPQTQAQLVESAEKEKDYRLKSARVEINEWQSELLLGTISDEDKASLQAWLNYIKELKAVDISTAPDISWPQKLK